MATIDNLIKDTFRIHSKKINEKVKEILTTLFNKT